MYSDRPYRSKLPIEKVKSIMFEEANRDLIDLSIVETLFELVEQEQVAID